MAKKKTARKRQQPSAEAIRHQRDELIASVFGTHPRRFKDHEAGRAVRMAMEQRMVVRALLDAVSIALGCDYVPGTQTEADRVINGVIARAQRLRGETA